VRRIISLSAALPLCALAGLLAGCGNTLQTYPIPHNLLENLVVSPYPVYWLGGRFQGLEVTESSRDVSGAYDVEYGNCLQGGEGNCIPPLRIVTSPDNSFLPGGPGTTTTARIRGQLAQVSNSGRAIALGTGNVVVDIYADKASLALGAAKQMVTIDQPGAPGEALPAPLPDTGFASKPLPAQMPTLVRPLGFVAPNP
jgi:hypothetical protein